MMSESDGKIIERKLGDVLKYRIKEAGIIFPKEFKNFKASSLVEIENIFHRKSSFKKKTTFVFDTLIRNFNNQFVESLIFEYQEAAKKEEVLIKIISWLCYNNLRGALIKHTVIDKKMTNSVTFRSNVLKMIIRNLGKIAPIIKKIFNSIIAVFILNIKDNILSSLTTEAPSNNIIEIIINSFETTFKHSKTNLIFKSIDREGGFIDEDPIDEIKTELLGVGGFPPLITNPSEIIIMVLRMLHNYLVYDTKVEGSNLKVNKKEDKLYLFAPSSIRKIPMFEMRHLLSYNKELFDAFWGSSVDISLTMGVGGFLYTIRDDIFDKEYSNTLELIKSVLHFNMLKDPFSFYSVITQSESMVEADRQSGKIFRPSFKRSSSGLSREIEDFYKKFFGEERAELFNRGYERFTTSFLDDISFREFGDSEIDGRKVHLNFDVMETFLENRNFASTELENFDDKLSPLDSKMFKLVLEKAGISYFAGLNHFDVFYAFQKISLLMNSAFKKDEALDLKQTFIQSVNKRDIYKKDIVYGGKIHNFLRVLIQTEIPHLSVLLAWVNVFRSKYEPYLDIFKTPFWYQTWMILSAVTGIDGGLVNIIDLYDENIKRRKEKGSIEGFCHYIIKGILRGYGKRIFKKTISPKEFVTKRLLLRTFVHKSFRLIYNIKKDAQWFKMSTPKDAFAEFNSEYMVDEGERKKIELFKVSLPKGEELYLPYLYDMKIYYPLKQSPLLFSVLSSKLYKRDLIGLRDIGLKSEVMNIKLSNIGDSMTTVANFAKKIISLKQVLPVDLVKIAQFTTNNFNTDLAGVRKYQLQAFKNYFGGALRENIPKHSLFKSTAKIVGISSIDFLKKREPAMMFKSVAYLIIYLTRLKKKLGNKQYDEGLIYKQTYEVGNLIKSLKTWKNKFFKKKDKEFQKLKRIDKMTTKSFPFQDLVERIRKHFEILLMVTARLFTQSRIKKSNFSVSTYETIVNLLMGINDLKISNLNLIDMLNAIYFSITKDITVLRAIPGEKIADFLTHDISRYAVSDGLLYCYARLCKKYIPSVGRITGNIDHDIGVYFRRLIITLFPNFKEFAFIDEVLKDENEIELEPIALMGSHILDTSSKFGTAKRRGEKYRPIMGAQVGAPAKKTFSHTNKLIHLLLSAYINRGGRDKTILSFLKKEK